MTYHTLLVIVTKKKNLISYWFGNISLDVCVKFCTLIVYIINNWFFWLI